MAEAMKKFPRGRPVPVEAEFDGVPDEVFFSYMPPGQSRAVVDPGSKQPGTKIARVSERRYRYVVDTRGMRGGVLRCHMWSESGFVDSEFPEFEIEDAPAQLL